MLKNLTYLLDERHLVLMIAFSAGRPGAWARNNNEIKFCQKIAGFVEKENRKSNVTSIYLLNVRSSFLFFLFPIEQKRNHFEKLTLTIQKLYL